MTLQINSDEEKIDLLIDGDIYDEHAEFLRDMTLTYARRGIKEMDIRLCSTYYISTKSQQYLRGIRDSLTGQGVKVSFSPNL